MSEVVENAPRKRGRPSNAERAARAAVEELKPKTAADSDTLRSAKAAGRAVAVGRDGEVLTRKRTITSDIFHIPPEIVPPNYSYQWNVMEVLNQPQTAQRLAMQENGWRPVPASRHPGYFMPVGYEGPIIRDGLILEERPSILTEEARAEELAKARRQVKDQQEQLRLTAKLPSGFSDDPKYRGTGAMARQTYEPAPADLRPRLEIDPG